MVVVLLDVFDALAFQVGNTLGMKDELLDFVVAAFVGGLDVDDGTEGTLTKDVVVFGLAPFHT